MAVNANAYVVPVDPNTLTATASPFESFDDSVAHYCPRFCHAGLQLGPQCDGGTLVALRATQRGCRAWLAAEGVESREVDNGESRVRVDKTHRDPAGYVRVHCAPPRPRSGGLRATTRGYELNYGVNRCTHR